MSPKPRLARCALIAGDHVGRLHVGHEAQIDFRHRACGKHRLAARAGVAADQVLRCSPSAATPAARSPAPTAGRRSNAARRVCFFDCASLRIFDAVRDHRLLLRADRPRLRVIVDRDLVAVVRDERVQRLHQMPRRAVHHRLERGMNVLRRTASPLLAARDQLQARPRLSRPRLTVTTPSRSCIDEGMKTPTVFASAASTSGFDARAARCAANQSPPRLPRPSPGSPASSCPRP